METAAYWMLRKRRMRFTPMMTRIMDTGQQEKLMNRFYSFIVFCPNPFRDQNLSFSTNKNMTRKRCMKMMGIIMKRKRMGKLLRNNLLSIIHCFIFFAYQALKNYLSLNQSSIYP